MQEISHKLDTASNWDIKIYIILNLFIKHFHATVAERKCCTPGIKLNHKKQIKEKNTTKTKMDRLKSQQ